MKTDRLDLVDDRDTMRHIGRMYMFVAARVPGTCGVLMNGQLMDVL
jgi:hypothetical protein